MFKKDLLIPALLGLGVYTQSCDVSLCNNTTMMLALAVLLSDHEEIAELKKHDQCEHCNYQPARFCNGGCNGACGGIQPLAAEYGYYGNACGNGCGCHH